MAEYRYTAVPGKLKTLLEKIREIAVPQKATNRWLKSLGFTSSNDASLLTVLKFLGFTDSRGTPLQLWRDYRDAQYKQVLAEAIRTAYSELYGTYSDAHQRSQQDLESFFRTKTSAGQQVVAKTVSTFKSLCSLADFTTEPSTSPPDVTLEADVASSPGDLSPPSPNESHATPELHIDIQVHISADASVEQIDQIFASMARHIYPRQGAST